MFADKGAAGNLAVVPLDVNVVTIGLVFHERARCFGLKGTPFLVASVPTHADIMGLAQVLANVVAALATIRAHAAVFESKVAVVPLDIEVVRVRFVSS